MAYAHANPQETPEDEDLLDAEEAAEVVPEHQDEDHPMESDGEEDHEQLDGIKNEEVEVQNDSKAYFDKHADSIFCIAQHPINTSIVATGSADDAAYVFSSEYSSRQPPTSAGSGASQVQTRSLEPLARLSGHTDSVNAISHTLPNGDFLLTGGLDGQLRVYNAKSESYECIASVKEVDEINFIAPCPEDDHPNTVAIGASDGTVWIYTLSQGNDTEILQSTQVYSLHTGPCTASAWTPDGRFLATVSEDGSLYVWDPHGMLTAAGNQPIVSLTSADRRFEIEGGVYSVAVSPRGGIIAVGGAEGQIRIVSLPRINDSGQVSVEQAGQILASLQLGGESIETLSFSSLPVTILASGSVDGSITLLDVARQFAVRRKFEDAHDGYAVVKVAFARREGGPHLLMSCGLDGAVRAWDVRGGSTASGQSFLQEFKGHRGGGEGGGVMDFVVAEDVGRIVTAGDDGVSLVFGTAS